MDLNKNAKNDISTTPSQELEPTAESWGQLHVSRKCCGAATCRNFAPELLGEVPPAQGLRDDGNRVPALLPGSYEPGAFTGVIRQPRNREEYQAARTAVAACPFAAIRISKPTAPLSPGELGAPWRDWPRRLEDNVWAVGHPSTRNYGALSYFIELPGGGVLVDLPKPSSELFAWLEAHGGVRWLFLSHRDHVQHHAELAARFPGCRRVLGAADVNTRQNAYADATDTVEVKLGSGPGPMTLDGTPIAPEALADAELAVLPQPGHTPGSLCLLYRGRFLFSGDHLMYSRHQGHIIAPRLQCWESWERQCRSVSTLVSWAQAGQLRFQWLLPGHGEWFRFEGDARAAATAEELKRAAEWMRQQPPGHVPLLRWIPFVLSRSSPRGLFSRFVSAVGGAGRDAWLLPRAARQYLTDYDPAKADAALRRLYALAGASLVTATLLAWLAKRVL